MVEHEAETVAGTAAVDAPGAPEPTGRLAPADSVLARVRSRLPEFTGALQRVADQVLADPDAVRPGHHRRAGRAQRHLTGHGHPVLPGAGLRGLRRPAAGHRGRDRPGPLGRLDRRHRTGDPAGRPAGAGARARSWPPTPGPCTTPPRCWILARSNGRRRDRRCQPGEHLRRQRQRAGRRGDAVQPAPHRCRRLGLERRARGLASAALLRTGDVALGISHTGQTRETIETLAEAGSHGATTVALTGFPARRWPSSPTSSCSPPARPPRSGRTRSPHGTHNWSCSTCSTSPSRSVPMTGRTRRFSAPPGLSTGTRRWADTGP